MPKPYPISIPTLLTDCHISEILIDTTIKVKDYGMCNIAFTMSCQCTIALHEFTRYNP